MKRFVFPDSLILIFAIIIAAQLLTYLIPAGEFDRERVETPLGEPQEVTLPEGRGIRVVGDGDVLPEGGKTIILPEGTKEESTGRKVLPGTYRRVEGERLPWHAFLTKIPSGMEKASEIIIFVLIVGGVIAVVRRTGAIDALIGAAIHHFRGSPVLLTGGMMTLFAVGSSTIGMAEEYVPFIPILVAMCLALRMDAIVALAIVYVGAGIGYGCASLNPFTVMIAKDIAGQDPATGFWVRWGLLVVMVVIGVHHLLRYAKRVQEDPSKSLVAHIDYTEGFRMPEDVRLTPGRVAVLVAFAAMIAFFVWGVTVHEWYLIELTALFLGLAIVASVAGRLAPNEAAEAFTTGAAELAGTAVLIGFARTIEVVLVDGRVIDTVIYGIASAISFADGLGAVAPVVAAWTMLIVQSIFNFFVPSGSGQAFVTMPIMAPLADLTGIGRETAILAYQFGDGFTNMIVPTNAILMGMLLLGRIPYQRWLRFILPLLGKFYVVMAIALAVAALIQWH
ncbi:MAG TPA: YfcC family protein [Thermoanaerobaculia bacterium]|nr:YfcC family protein [Thermoanaerobaculia bacterium]